MAEFKTLDEKAFRRKATGGAPRPRAVAARYDARKDRVLIALNTGIEFSFAPRDAHGLRDASPASLADVRVEGAGNTLRFPLLDADFSITGLLEGFLGPLDWTKREARAAASRQNGKLGGRPRKAAAPTT